MKPKWISTLMSQGQRSVQEDHLLIEKERGIFVIADGFGGPTAGVEAAQTACEAVKSFLFKEAGDLEATLPFELRSYFSLAGNILFNAMIHSNRRIIELNREKNVHERGGASVLAAFVDECLLAIANVGVCTAWLYRNGQFVALVVPRSFGKLRNPLDEEPPEEYKVPLMALGTSRDLEPEIVEYRLQEGDWLILNTDGVPRVFFDRISKLQESKLEMSQVISSVSQLFRDLESTIQDNATISLIVF